MDGDGEQQVDHRSSLPHRRWRCGTTRRLLQLVTWHGSVILAVLGMLWPSTVVGDVGGWWWPLVTVACTMVVVVEEEVVVDDAQIENHSGGI